MYYSCWNQHKKLLLSSKKNGAFSRILAWKIHLCTNLAFVVDTRIALVRPLRVARIFSSPEVTTCKTKMALTYGVMHLFSPHSRRSELSFNTNVVPPRPSKLLTQQKVTIKTWYCYFFLFIFTTHIPKNGTHLIVLNSLLDCYDLLLTRLKCVWSLNSFSHVCGAAPL